MKSGQKIWAGPAPSFGQNPKEQLLFSGDRPLVMHPHRFQKIEVEGIIGFLQSYVVVCGSTVHPSRGLAKLASSSI